MKRRYLFVLEISPLETGKTYAELPSHLTLISRFFSELPPDYLATIVRPLFEQIDEVALIFKEATKLGPKRLVVHDVEHSGEIKRLHASLHNLLSAAHAEFEYPQFTGKNHKPHVTKREGIHFHPGDKLTIKRVCLIEVIEGERIVRSIFTLQAHSQ